MKSILQDKKECYVTGAKTGLHKHHVFGGANRKLSEQYGLYIWLLPGFHNLGEECIHQDKEFDLRVKRMAQSVAMGYYGWSIEDFRSVFGKSYL